MAQPETIRELPIDKIDDTKENNMRSELKDIPELAGSIEARGLLNPIIVKETGGGDYKLIAGFRRVAAHKHLQRDTIEAKIKPQDLSHEEELMIQAAENIDRADPSTYDVAMQLRRIITECHMTNESVAKRLNKSSAWVSNYLGLFDLPEAVQQKAKEGGLGIIHVRFLHAMLKRVEEKDLITLSNRIVGKDQGFMDKIRERLSKQIRGQGRKATAEEVATAHEERENDSQEEVEDTPQSSDKRISARSREEILDAIDRIKDQFDEVQSPKEHARLNGRMEGLQWVLGDDDVHI